MLYTREEVSSAFSEFLIAMKQQETTILWASKSHKVHRTLGASIRLMCSAIFPFSSSLFFFCPLLCHVLFSYYLASFHDNCAKGKGSLKKKNPADVCAKLCLSQPIRSFNLHLAFCGILGLLDFFFLLKNVLTVSRSLHVIISVGYLSRYPYVCNLLDKMRTRYDYF